MKVKIPVPQKFLFKTEITVRVTDLNYGAHLGNDSVLSIAHEARVRFLKEYGFSELNLGGDVALILFDAAIEFKAEAFLGDNLVIEVSPENIRALTFDLYYRITRKEDNKVVANIKTGMAGFNYSQRKPAPLPENLKDLWSKDKV